MILEEYSNLVTTIADKDFPVRELPFCFNNSIRLQIDEIDSDRHYNMLFPEFLEAICRAIDIASPVPPRENPVSSNFLN